MPIDEQHREREEPIEDRLRLERRRPVMRVEKPTSFFERKGKCERTRDDEHDVERDENPQPRPRFGHRTPGQHVRRRLRAA